MQMVLISERIAVARKILIILNAMLRDRRQWQPA